MFRDWKEVREEKKKLRGLESGGMGRHVREEEIAVVGTARCKESQVVERENEFDLQKK